MEKYYVSGCKDNGSETVTCDDSEAQFWTLYVRDDTGLSQGIIDCVFREDAAAAMAVYVERDAHLVAEVVWEKTMMETIGEDGVGSVKAAFEKLQSERDSLQEQVRALAAEKENARDVMLYAANNISYAIFNLSDKKLSDLKRGLSDTTCPTDTALLAERELRIFADRIRAGEQL